MRFLYTYFAALTERQKTALFSLILLYVLSWTGSFLGLFDSITWIDIPFHFLGGFLIGLFAIDMFKDALVGSPGILRDAVILVGIALLVGFLWEMYEYILDIFFRDFFLSRGIKCCIGDLFDTLKDLFDDSLGGLVVYFVVRFRHPDSPMFK